MEAKTTFDKDIVYDIVNPDCEKECMHCEEQCELGSFMYDMMKFDKIKSPKVI